MTASNMKSGAGDSDAGIYNIPESDSEVFVSCGFFQFTPWGRIIFISDSLAGLLGYSSAGDLTRKVEGNAMALFTEPEAFFSRAGHGGASDRIMETTAGMRKKTGSLFPARVRVWRTGNAEQPVLEGVLEKASEISPERCSSRDYYARYQALFERSSDCILLHDAEGRITDFNKAILSLTGYDGMDMLSLNIKDLVFSKDLGAIEELSKSESTNGAQNSFIEFRIRCKSGDSITMEASRTRVKRPGLPEAYQYIGRDITLRKRDEKALRDSERSLAEIINFLPDATFVIDADRKVAAWNQALEQLTGVKGADMLGKGDYEYAIPFYGCRRPVLIDLVFESDPEIERRYAYVKREGDLLFSETRRPAFRPEAILWNTARLLYDAEGNPVGAIESVRDITARVRAEEALKDSEERYRSILENMQEGYYEIDLAGKIIFLNEALARMVGIDRDELKGLNARSAAAPEGADEILKAFNDVYTTGRDVSSIELQFVDREGNDRFFETSISLVRDPEGRAVGFKGVTRDVTERVKAGKEREELIGKLRKLLAEVKTLSGFLPICSNCKKIRDDEGYWRQVEQYVEEHSSAQFSHGICPECAQRLYPELFKKK